MDYKTSGVDIEKGDRFVKTLGQLVKSTYNQNVISGVGGYAAIYDLGAGQYLASGTDGVGTKLKLAFQSGHHETIGIDLVAMVVNDLICAGAKPLFFQDYFATGKLDELQAEAVLKGIVQGCQIANCALIGGETAEMPDFYHEGEYDLSGFGVGLVSAEALVDGKAIEPGDQVFGIGSNGFHSNGYSLIRKLFKDSKWIESLLTPTRIYVSPILELLAKHPKEVTGLAHITGGGVKNLLRLSPRVGFELEWPNPMELKEDNPKKLFGAVSKDFGIPPQDLYQTFNMGVGFCLIVKPSLSLEKLVKSFDSHQMPVYPLGRVNADSGVLTLNPFNLHYTQ